ncbi:hypothetical protein QQ045_032267 [Rhodiola kirilowii]
MAVLRASARQLMGQKAYRCNCPKGELLACNNIKIRLDKYNAGKGKTTAQGKSEKKKKSVYKYNWPSHQSLESWIEENYSAAQGTVLEDGRHLIKYEPLKRLGDSSPKVEMLVWRIYLDSLPSKIFCVFCGEEQESSNHLLLHCDWSWKVWAGGLSWWGCCWVVPKTAKSLLESWKVGGSSKSARRLGKVLCYAILWSIWEERNKRCFQNQKRSVDEIEELVKARVAWWAKFRGKKCPYPVDTIKRCRDALRRLRRTASS